MQPFIKASGKPRTQDNARHCGGAGDYVDFGPLIFRPENMFDRQTAVWLLQAVLVAGLLAGLALGVLFWSQRERIQTALADQLYGEVV